MSIPKHYSLVQEHPHSYEIHDARDDSKFHVAKSGLNLQMHANLSKIQKFDLGGEVNSESVNDSPEQIAADASSLPPQSGGASGEWQPPVNLGPSPASVPAGDASTNVAPPVDPMASASQAGNDALAAEKTALMAGANAEGAESGASSKAYKDYAAKMDQMLTPQQIYERHQAQDDALMKQYMSKNIDPDAYWKKAGTVGKISAAIGMLFGGVGSAITGRPNYAMENINNAINREIDAQKEDQSKTMNLWKMNREATQDETHANLATQNQMLNGVKAKIMQYQAQYAGPQARARIAPAIAQIDQQIAQNNYKRALLTSQGGGMSQIAPEKLVPMLVPQEHQKQAFTEIGQAKSAVENESAIKQAFDQAAKDTRPATGRSATSVMNTIPGYSPPSIKALNLLYDPLIHDNEGRINELEQKHVQANSPQWGDSDETVQKKWAAIQSFINHKKQATTASAYGIDPSRFISTAGNGAAPQFKVVNGVKYMRGPNGQAIPVK